MKIPQTHKNDGFTACLIESEWPFAIYERSKPKCKAHFELVKFSPSKSDRRLPDGGIIPAGSISYPSKSQWGRAGWTFTNLSDATCKMKSLIKTTTDKRKETT